MTRIPKTAIDATIPNNFLLGLSKLALSTDVFLNAARGTPFIAGDASSLILVSFGSLEFFGDTGAVFAAPSPQEGQCFQLFFSSPPHFVQKIMPKATNQISH